jgi:hypothetical protein
MHIRLAVVLAMSFALDSPEVQAAELTRDYPIRPVPAHQVRFTDAFWWPRLEVNRTATIPVSFQMCEETGRIENFKVAAGLSDKKWTGKFGFNDSDVSKVLEGAAYSLMTHPDAKLQSYADELIGLMAAAQEDDGYLYTAWTSSAAIGNGTCVSMGEIATSFITWATCTRRQRRIFRPRANATFLTLPPKAPICS